MKQILIGILAATSWVAFAQDDSTTRNGSSGYHGAFITGPASNPLSFLNGAAYRTFNSAAPYDLPDFRPASVLDRSLPKWIQLGAEERFRFESNNTDSYLLNRFRLQMTLKPASWFKVVTQVQDARPFLQEPPIGPPNENTWDFKLAYVDFGDAEKNWFSVRVGRQLINYNNTLIANSEWRNQARSYDAAVINLHYDRFRAGIFAASVVNPLAHGISHHREGNNLYGIYGGIDKLLPNSVLEPFVLWRVAPNRISETTAGFRWKGRVIGDLDYSFEAAWQRGRAGTNSIDAAATTFGAGYRASNVSWKPRVFAQYDYATGDNNSSDKVHGTFDTMYPTAHDRFGITDQFGWQNIKAARAGFTIEPRHRWTITGQYLHFWLASATDAVYSSSGAALVRDATGSSGTNIGGEVDAYTWYELNQHLNIGVGVGHLMPGRFLLSTSRNPSYTSPYLAINFKDDGKFK